MTHFKKIILLFVLFLQTNMVVSPNQSGVLNKPLFDMNQRIDSLKQRNIKILKTSNFNGNQRDSVGLLLNPFVYRPVKQYVDSFACDEVVLSSIIKTVFIIESSDAMGNPANSVIFKKYNNPFGIKQYNKNGASLYTYEEINGKKVYMYCNFQTFPSLEDAINEWFLLILSDRYKSVRSTVTAKEFFHEMKRCGYMTSSHWVYMANDIYDDNFYGQSIVPM